MLVLPFHRYIVVQKLLVIIIKSHLGTHSPPNPFLSSSLLILYSVSRKRLSHPTDLKPCMSISRHMLHQDSSCCVKQIKAQHLHQNPTSSTYYLIERQTFFKNLSVSSLADDFHRYTPFSTYHSREIFHFKVVCAFRKQTFVNSRL